MWKTLQWSGIRSRRLRGRRLTCTSSASILLTRMDQFHTTWSTMPWSSSTYPLHQEHGCRCASASKTPPPGGNDLKWESLWDVPFLRSCLWQLWGCPHRGKTGGWGDRTTIQAETTPVELLHGRHHQPPLDSSMHSCPQSHTACQSEEESETTPPPLL